MNRKILNLAIPNIVSNITIPLLGMVDLALLGHLKLDAEIYIGAIALGTMIFNFVYWGFGFLRMGTTGFAAQAYGERNFQNSILILSRAMLVALIIGFALILLQYPIAELSFMLVDGSERVESIASQYFYIRIWAAPATIGLYAFMGWFLGMQNSKIPMVLALVINIVNIIFNVLFVYGFGMKSDGVAYGTVIAQYSGFLLAVFFFYKYYRKLLKYWSYKAMMKLGAFKEFMRVNTDIMIRTLLLIFALSFFTAQSAKISDSMLAVNTLLYQYFIIFAYLLDGFAFSAEALVGKAIGAKNKPQLKKVIRLLFIWGLAISVPFSLSYLFAGSKILYILTNDKEVIAQTLPYMFWVALIPILSFAAFLWDGIYIGATASKAMRNAMIVSTLFVFIPAYYLLVGPMGNHGIWLALMIFLLSRGVALHILAKKSIYGQI